METTMATSDLNSSTPQPGDGKALELISSMTLTTDMARLRAAGFQLLLDRGEPIDPSDIATAAGLDLPTVERLIEQAAGRIEIDDDGRLLGIAGLTVVPTRHEITIGDEKRWTWCALDAVGILGALGATGTIHSADAQTGADVHIEFVDGQPQGDTTLFILGGYDGGNVTEEWCPLVNFFTNHTDAEDWVADREVSGDIVSVSQIAGDATEMWLPVTNPA